MKLFDKRPLCMILCILLGGFVFFSDSSLYLKLGVAIFAFIFAISIFFIKKISKKIRILSIASATMLLLSYALSFLYFDCYFNVYNLYNGEVTVCGVVTDVNENDYGASLYIRCESINEDKRNNKIRAYVNNDTKSFVEVNTRIIIVGRLVDFGDGEDYQTRMHMRSNGYSAELTDVTSYMITEKVSQPLEYKISEYRNQICDKFISSAGAVGGGLLSALLLGEKGYLPHQTALSFRRCGLSHMLALSGLHLTIITFAISFALSLLKVKKKTRKVIEIIFVVLYSLLTGMPISVVRAALMHVIASVIFLIGAKMDSITSLAISVGIICTVMPYAIYDAALWLSAFATLGVLIYSELESEKIKSKEKSIIKRVLGGLLSGILVSLFAIGATYLLTCIFFGEISIIGIFTTPLLSALITPFMYLGLLLILLLFIRPIGILVDILGKLILEIITALSSIKGIYLSADNVFTNITVIVFTLLLIAFLLIDIKKKKISLIVLLALFININLSAVTASIITLQKDDNLYFCNEYDEYFIIKSKGVASVIDVSSNTVGDDYQALAHVNGEGLTEIDKYIYTNYNANTVNSILGITNSLYVKELYIPKPVTADENMILNYLNDFLSGGLTKLITYSLDDVIKLGNYEVLFPLRVSDKEISAFYIINEIEEIICYTSSGALGTDTKIVASEMISKCDTLILGRHGENYSNYRFILEYPNIEKIILSSNNLTIPKDVREYYSNSNIIERSERISFKH